MAVPAGSSDSTWVLVLASAANLMVGLDALVVSTALTEIGRELGASIEALEWTVNAYALSFAAFLLTAAVLGDRFGRRRRRSRPSAEAGRSGSTAVSPGCRPCSARSSAAL